MKDIEIKGLTEKQFEAYFYSLSDPNEQIAKLAEWRRYQSQVVSKFIDQIRLMANEQYTNLDHFLLELLQNADDNEYEKEVAPAVTILLTEKSFTLWNNEKGFNDRNLFAITYAAATTKFREKTGATFIGEKGIGFKSVFAVADYVDIHSDPYHFRLYNDEFIVPNALSSMPGKGTQIILKLRDSNKDIPQLLSNRLQTLCTSAQEFTLFLQKIEKLEVRDEVSGEEGKVTTLRDKDKGFYVVENNGREVSFITISYQEEIPEHIVKTRFREIDSDLNREIVFAIPLPPEDGAPLPRDGRLFCFLPTEVKTGTPIHVQVDAKTITNRENIASFDNSEWNRAVFKDFVPHMVSMYVSLTGREELEKYLPVYWPYDIDEIDINNKDLQSLIIQVKDELKNKEIVLDRHGTFQSPEFVRLLPDELYPFFYEDKFEKALSKYLVGDKEYQYEDGSKVEPEDVFTLVSESWAKAYEKQLMALGVEVIDENGQLAMFKGGAPDSVNILDDTEVRKLLELVMDYGQSLKKSTNWNKPEIGDLKSCSIFPVKSGDKRKWGPISSGVMWLQSDSPGARGSRKIAIVDPAFTYSPGGGGTKKQEIEEVREFNKRFRDFLTDDLDIPPFSIAEFQRRTTIKELQSTSVDVNDPENRRKINEEWVQLYSQIWKRRKTILREKGEEYWKEILKEISQCKIPTRTAGENVWQLGIVSLAFIGAQFKTEDNLDKIYAGTGAPIITLDFIQRNTKSIKNKRQRRVDWEDWREFLTACEAEQGPFLENVDLSRQDRYSASYSSAYQDPQNQLGNAIKEGVNSHWEYKAEGGRSFYLSANSITVTIDNWSQKLLGSLTSDFLARKLSELWPRLGDFKTRINFIWGQKQNARHVAVDSVLLHEHIRAGLLLWSNKGLKPSRDCFIDDKFNRRILGDLVPYVNPQKGGYNSDLLNFVGVKEAVMPSDVLDLINKWYEATPSKNRTTMNFLPYIQVVLRLCRVVEEYIPEIRMSLLLYARGQDHLLPVDQWKVAIGHDEYPDDLVKEILSILEIKKRTSIEEVVEDIFSISDLPREVNVLVNLLRDLGAYCRAGMSDKVSEVFQEKLKTTGLYALGDKIDTLKDLPILWDAAPYPDERAKVLRVPPNFWKDEVFLEAVLTVSWPLLSKVSKDVILGEKATVEDHVARHIYHTFHELRQNIMGSQPHIKSKIDGLGLFDSIGTVKQNILLTDNIKMKLSNNGETLEADISYWYTGGTLYVAKEELIEEVLPEFVDLSCGTTFSGLFKYIWNDQELISEVYVPVGKPGDTEGIDSGPPEHALAGQKGASSVEDGSKSALQESIFDEDQSEDDAGKPSDKKFEGPNGVPRKRSRLFSYVLGPGQKKEDKEDVKEANRRKEVEKAGAEKLTAYFGKLGASCRSVEKENIGYDFEVTVGEETFYVELKASEFKWDGWEECLTPKEFSKAQELGDRYFLCIIDRVLSADCQMHFIKDPAGSVDGFMFDHPWKHVATDMNVYISNLKSDQHILEE